MVSDPVARQRLMALYEQRLAADPSSRTFLPLAELYRLETRPEDARLLLEAGLARHPEFVSAQVVLAQVLLDLGDEARAQEVLARVVARDPENLVALRLLASAAVNREDWAGVVEHLEQIVRLEPTDREAVARLLSARNKLSDKTLAESPAATAPREKIGTTIGDVVGGVFTLTLADLYIRQGYTERARELLLRMAADEPDREDVRERLARLDQMEGSAGTPAAAVARRRTSGERQDERQRFEAWLERATED